jgi:ATP-dependent Lon protease
MFGNNDSNREEILSQLPDDLPVLPLRNMVAFPFTVLPVSVGVPRSVRLVNEAMQDNRLIVLVTSHNPEIDEPTPDQVHQIGGLAHIQRVNSAERGLQMVVTILERVRVTEWVGTAPYLRAKVELLPDTEPINAEAEALRRSLLEVSRAVIGLMPNIPDEVADFLEQLENNRSLVYMIAANSNLEVQQRQVLLELDDTNAKMRLLISTLNREREVLTIGQKISEETQEKLGKEQREFFLRRQMDQIRRELGEVDDEATEVENYRKKLADAGLPAEAHQQAERELKRLERTNSQAAEHGVIRNYLDWMIDLPWTKRSEDNLDIEHARRVLDEDHYGLKTIKSRILEYLAVRKLAKERGTDQQKQDSRGAGAILLFVGPPGVGKTSLGKSIARALGREFTRMSLGGMRDEAEIRGHRRTYIGAMPGRIIQAIKRGGTRNPVFILDEVDKIGSDWRGDPSSALLEVLDPQQNNAFRDHYLDVDFDLSDVIFITTANQIDTIPAPLLDRMEVIQLDGYTEHEKVRIAQEHLVGRQVQVNSLTPEEINFTEPAIRRVINDYTREAGVRTLEREIGKVIRKAAVKIAGGTIKNVRITPAIVKGSLGKPRIYTDSILKHEVPGVATGLAWTPVGGDVLFVEATRSKGHGSLTITGQLGKVMEESVRIAYSLLRARAVQLGIDPDLFESNDFHIHVPEGAIPKDGPSAGITMTSALYSLLSGRTVRNEVGMTGEITLRGEVLPIGGTMMKVLAAHRAGLKTIILPKRNLDDLDDLPKTVREALTLVPVERIEQVFEAAIRVIDPPKPRKTNKRNAPVVDPIAQLPN